MSRTSSEDSVRVNGSGSQDRVDADRFEVNGTATVHEDVLARAVSVDGSLDVGGALESEEVDLDGSTSVDGDAHAESLEIDGSGSFGGDLSVDRFDADGSTSVAGNLDGHEVESDGSTTVEGNLVAKAGAFDGRVTVGGLADVTDLAVAGAGSFGDVAAGTFEVAGALDADEVRAERFDLELAGESSVGTVRAGEAHVRKREGLGSLLSGLLNRSERVLGADTVVGDRLELDATVADTVAAETVVLGADAEVDVVYADDLDADDGATVGDVRPYGAYDRSGADDEDPAP